MTDTPRHPEQPGTEHEQLPVDHITTAPSRINDHTIGAHQFRIADMPLPIIKLDAGAVRHYVGRSRNVSPIIQPYVEPGTSGAAGKNYRYKSRGEDGRLVKTRKKKRRRRKLNTGNDGCGRRERECWHRRNQRKKNNKTARTRRARTPSEEESTEEDSDEWESANEGEESENSDKVKRKKQSSGSCMGCRCCE